MKKLIFIILSVTLFFISCDSLQVYEEYITIPDGIWNRYQPIKFEVEVSDTMNPHNIYINVRNGSYYPFSNLFVFITTKAPNGNMIKDTLEITLADDKGKWLGKGLGDIWDLQRIYKQNIRFPVSGIYTFEIEQAMRKEYENLPHILDVGLRVERVK